MARDGHEPFRLGGSRIYHGPNPFAAAPVIAVRLEASAGADLDVEAADRSLRQAFPRLLSEAPEAKHAGESVVALARLLAFLARGALNDTRGLVAEAGAARTGPGAAALWVGYHDARVTEAAIAFAARALRTALGGAGLHARELTKEFDALQGLCRRRHPDFQARILMVAARCRDIPVVPVEPGARIWQFGWGARSRSFFETASDADGFVGTRIARSKTLSKAILRDLGMPTPPGVLVSAATELAAAAATVGWPCVVKPVDGSRGNGVSVGVRTQDDLERAFAHARTVGPAPVMVEAFVPGEDHRLTVIDGSLVAVTRREAPSVIGDGVRTVQGLLDELNSRRSANLVASGYLVPVAADRAVLATLARQELELDAVPRAGRRVWLRGNANRSTGGVCFDVPEFHPQLRAMAEAIARTLGLYALGIDYITADVMLPPKAGNGAFIEVNHSPGLAALVVAGTDEAEIGARLLGLVPGRIPITLVMAEEDAQREIAPMLTKAACENPGLAWLCGADAGVGAVRLGLAHLHPPQRVSALLKHRCATGVVLAWSLQDLQQYGLPVDKADLGVLHGIEKLPQPWQRVLASACGRLATATDPDGILGAALAESAPQQKSPLPGGGGSGPM